MKTSKSKKLLSFFLAAVMLVTSCSVGFTAFASNSDKGIWNDSTKAADTYDSLNDLFDTYFPVILDAIGADTLSGIGVDLNAVKSAKEPMYEFMAELAPLLIQALGSSSSISGILGKAYTGMSERYYSYLNDSKAGMSFWSLYQYCNDNQNSSNHDVAAYCSKTFPVLERMLQAYPQAKADYTASITNATNAILAEFSNTVSDLEGDNRFVVKDSKEQINTPSDTSLTIEEIGNAQSNNGKKLSEYTDTVNGVDVKPFIEYMQKLLRTLGIIGSSKQLTLSEAVYYTFNTSVETSGVEIYLATKNSDKYTRTVERFGQTKTVTFNSAKTYKDDMASQFPIDEYYDYFKNTYGIDYNAETTTDLQKEYIDSFYSSSMDYTQNMSKEYAFDKANTDTFNIIVGNALVDAGIYDSIDSYNKAVVSNEINSSGIANLQRLFNKYQSGNDSELVAPDGGGTEINFKNAVANSSLSEAAKAYVLNTLASQGFDTFKASIISWTVGTPYNDGVQKFVDGVNVYFPIVKLSAHFGSVRQITSDNYANANLLVTPINGWLDMFQYNNFVSKNIPDNAKYVWNQVKPDSDLAINIANDLLNNILAQYLDTSDMVGNIIQGALDALLETQNVNLIDQLTDVYINVAENPIETIFELLPLLTCLIDEVIVPIFFNGNGDSQYQGGTGFLYPFLSDHSSVLGLLADYTQDEGSYVGVGSVRFDLNEALPAVMHWLTGDRQTDATGTYYTSKATGAKVYYNYYNNSKVETSRVLAVSRGDGTDNYEINITGDEVKKYTGIKDNKGNAITYDAAADSYSYNGSSNKVLSTLLKDYDGITFNFEMVYNDTVPNFINIYAADLALRDANINTLNVSSDAAVNTMAKEAIGEIANFFTNAVDIYLDGGKAGTKTIPAHRNDVKYINASGVTANKGINNLFVSIPTLLDIMGNMFADKYQTGSDWSYDYKLKENKYGGFYNESLQTFKDYTNNRANNKAVKVLECFVDIFINDWFNALLDFFNDTISTDNKITNEMPIIKGLLDSLGGLGSQSVISDVLNGVFQLEFDDNASFAMSVNDKESGYVGLSRESAYFLLSNIGQLIQVISSIDTKTANVITSSYATGSPGKGVNTPVWGDVPSTTSKDGNSFVERLDAAVSGLLENSTINNFNLNTTTGIASGVISLLSYYFGSDNKSDMVKLLNSYLYQLNGQDKKGTNTSKEVVYTQDNLTNLVVQTYTLLENILEYYITEQDSVKINVFYDTNKKVYSTNSEGRYVYNILTEALKGLISPHAVSTHITDKTSAQKIAELPSWHNAIKISGNNNGKTGETAISINWGFKNGDAKAFYSGICESLGIISDLAGVLIADTGLYDGVIYPLLTDLAIAQGKDLGVYAKGSVTDGVSAVMSIITPVGNLLTEFYSRPVSVLLNLVKGLSIFISKDLDTAAHGLSNIVKDTVKGISNVLGADISNLMPSMAANDLWFDKVVDLIVPLIEKDTTKQAGVKKTVTDIVSGNYKLTEAELMNTINGALSGIITLPTNIFSQIAACTNSQQVLDLVLQLVVNIITDKDILNSIKALINNSTVSQLLDMIGQLSYDKLSNIIKAVLAKTQDPTEVYWTFLQYVQKETTGFYYPAGITAQNADDAVGKLDNAVTSVIGLLNGLGVVDKDNTKDLVSSLLFTNSNLTKFASVLYGALDGDVAYYLYLAGIDVTTDGLAKLLMDKSYGKTYSSAAKKIQSTEFWKDLDGANINWGFTDGSAKAEQGFVNAFAAILRPFNEVLTMLLAGDNLKLGTILSDVVTGLEIKSDTVSLADGMLSIKVKGADPHSRTSIIKLDLVSVVEQIKSLELYGSNAYESAVTPLLETLMCDNVKTYKQYKSDIAKSKDSVLTDVLNPLVGLVNDVLDAPFDTLSAIIPNLAYFINNNGLSQLVNNLLSPITSLIPVLKDNGLDLDVVINAILGKSLNSYIKDLLGVNINLKLTDLNSCKLQKAIVPLLNMLLKSLTKSDLKLPAINWNTLASHGTIKTVKSAALNAQGKYTTKRVVADQGETLVAVLRYVANVLTSNTKSIKSLLSGIDGISKDIMGIINIVLNQLSTASDDEIVQAVFYLLNEEPTNAFWNYSNYKTKDYDFAYPATMDVSFLSQLSPMLDGLIGGLIDLNQTIGDLLFTDSLVNKLVGAMYPAIDGVKINDDANLSDLLAMTGIDFTKDNFVKLLTDSSYGKTYASNAAIINSAASWSDVKFDNLKWGVTDRASFFNALCAALRPVYPVLDVFLNDASLGLFNIVSIPGSNGYTSLIVPLLEAFSGYNIKTQYQYREDINKAYDNILLDILNPLWDKVEDILAAPLQTLTAMLPNLALFIANDGLLQFITNLFTPVSALLDALKPIVDINDVLYALLDMLNVDLNKTMSKIGLNLGDLNNLNLYDLTATLKPIIGAEKLIPLINQVLGLIKIGGAPLGIELMDFEWLQLASHGEIVVGASQAATIGAMVSVEGDSSEVLIAVLRYLIKTINYKDNYAVINDLIGSLIGGASSTVSDIVGQVLGMLKGDTDEVIASLCDLLQTLGS